MREKKTVFKNISGWQYSRIEKRQMSSDEKAHIFQMRSLSQLIRPFPDTRWGRYFSQRKPHGPTRTGPDLWTRSLRRSPLSPLQLAHVTGTRTHLGAVFLITCTPTSPLWLTCSRHSQPLNCASPSTHTCVGCPHAATYLIARHSPSLCHHLSSIPDPLSPFNLIYPLAFPSERKQ